MRRENLRGLLDSTLVNDPDENVEAARVVRESTGLRIIQWSDTP